MGSKLSCRWKQKEEKRGKYFEPGIVLSMFVHVLFCIFPRTEPNCEL